VDILDQLEDKILNTIVSVEDLKQQLDDKSTQLKTSQSQLIEADAERLSLRAQLDEQREEIKALQHEKENQQALNQQLQQEVEALQQQRMALQDEKVQLMEEKQQFVSDNEALKQDCARLADEKENWAAKAASILEVLEQTELLKNREPAAQAEVA